MIGYCIGHRVQWLQNKQDKTHHFYLNMVYGARWSPASLNQYIHDSRPLQKQQKKQSHF